MTVHELQESIRHIKKEKDICVLAHSYGMLFIIGLLTSVHCIAMCGGINLSQSIPRGGKISFVPALRYNLGRVVSYTATGFVLGCAGWLFGGANAGLSVLLQGIGRQREVIGKVRK